MRTLQRVATAASMFLVLAANAPNQVTTAGDGRLKTTEALAKPTVAPEGGQELAPATSEAPGSLGANEVTVPYGQNESVEDYNDLLSEPIASDSAAVRDSGGFLGKNILMDILALLVVTVIGAGLSIVLAGWQWARSGLEAELARINGRIDHIETGLKAQAKLSQSVQTNTGSRSIPDHSLSAYRTSGGRGLSSERHPTQKPYDKVAEARANQQELSRHLTQIVNDYRKLVTTKGAKPRQFADILSDFPQVMAIQQQGSTMISAPYREADANQFLVAAGDGETYSVLPTYEYVSDFSIAFSKPVMNPELVRRLFELADDDTGQLQLAVPATVELDESGVFHLTRKGQLSGFRS